MTNATILIRQKKWKSFYEGNKKNEIIISYWTIQHTKHFKIVFIRDEGSLSYVAFFSLSQIYKKKVLDSWIFKIVIFKGSTCIGMSRIPFYKLLESMSDWVYAITIFQTVCYTNITEALIHAFWDVCTNFHKHIIFICNLKKLVLISQEEPLLYWDFHHLFDNYMSLSVG